MCHGQVIWDSVQRATKAHRCDLCSEPIKPKRVYSKLALKGDADEGLWTQKTCSGCVAKIELARDELDDGDGCLVGDIDSLARERSKASGWRKALEVCRAARAGLLDRLRRRKAAAT